MVTFSPAQTFRNKCRNSVNPVWGIWLILQPDGALFLFVCLLLLFAFAVSTSESISSRSVSALGLLEEWCWYWNKACLIHKTAANRVLIMLDVGWMFQKNQFLPNNVLAIQINTTEQGEGAESGSGPAETCVSWHILSRTRSPRLHCLPHLLCSQGWLLF